MQALFFLILFVSLFSLSRLLTSTISMFFHRITRSYIFAIHFLAVLFLPGVIVHELAHWLVASILFVPTGDIEFLPQIQGNSVKLGSVQIGKTDPIKKFIIGVAPFLLGVAVLSGIFWYFSPSAYPLTWKSFIFAYCIFEIGNTMFSSSKDMEGFIGFFILVFLFLLLLIFFHVPIVLLFSRLIMAELFQAILKTVNIFFIIAVGIDICTIILFRLVLLLLK